MSGVPGEPTEAGGRGDLMLLGRLLAVVDVLGHTGAREIEIAHQEECGEPEPIMWHVTALYKGTKMWSHHYPYPAQAAEDLMARVMNGGHCKRCNRDIVVGMDAHGFCCFTLTAADLDEPKSYRYIRSCEVGV